MNKRKKMKNMAMQNNRGEIYLDAIIKSGLYNYFRNTEKDTTNCR